MSLGTSRVRVCGVTAYRELFAATATSAAALTGLLFVALSVTQQGRAARLPPVIHQVRAAAALLAFNNALAVSLFSLVPGTGVGYPATVLGLVGIFFVAAGMRSIYVSDSLRRMKFRQLELMALLLLIFGTELVCGIGAIGHPGHSTFEQFIGYALVTSLIVGIARAWELVGDRDTGILASIAVLTGHERDHAGTTRSGLAQDSEVEDQA